MTIAELEIAVLIVSMARRVSKTYMVSCQRTAAVNGFTLSLTRILIEPDTKASTSEKLVNLLSDLFVVERIGNHDVIGMVLSISRPIISCLRC